MFAQTKPELKEKVNNLPRVPGVYIYRDIENQIIYVGKAKNLRNRVKSYFIDNLDPSSKTKALVDHIEDMSFIEVSSELEALILEAELIKLHKPYYNISLKDDRSYLYVVIRNEKVSIGEKQIKLPKLMVARKPDLIDEDMQFGPYPDATTARYIVRSLRKVFPYRDCSQTKFDNHYRLNRPCLYGHIGLCQAPCVHKDPEEHEARIQEYKKGISRLKEVLEGKSSSLLNDLKRKMQELSEKQEFEEAATYRNVISKFDYVRQHFKTAQSYIDNPYLVEDTLEKSLTELKDNVPVIDNDLERIECYDISNISGKEAVGAMTVAIHGRVDNSKYRKFKIKMKNEPNDFGMLQEVLRRRLIRGIGSEVGWELPELLVIDGGKGQISAISDVLKEMELQIPLIGLAKKFETIVFITGDDFTEIVLERSNEGLKLLQRLRDEAHRFGQKYHHQLRLKKITMKGDKPEPKRRPQKSI